MDEKVPLLTNHKTHQTLIYKRKLNNEAYIILKIQILTACATLTKEANVYCDCPPYKIFTYLQENKLQNREAEQVNCSEFSQLTNPTQGNPTPRAAKS